MGSPQYAETLGTLVERTGRTVADLGCRHSLVFLKD